MFNLDGSTRVLVIAADPIAQVKAPALFNQVFARFEVNAVMVPLQVRAVHLQSTLHSLLLSPSVAGISLSIPHKNAAALLCRTLTPLATQAQAVNALRSTADGSIDGALFDGTGLLRALDKAGFTYAHKRVLLIGAGGAGAAIIASLCRHAGVIAVYDPQVDKTLALARRFAGAGPADVAVARSNDPAGYDLVINASPLGLRDDDPLPADPRSMDHGCQVFDIVMKTPATAWVAQARQRGLAAANGFAMLEKQMPEYLRFFGFEALALAVEHDDSWLATS